MHGSHAWSLYSHTSSSPRGGKLRWGEPDTALSKHFQPPCVQHYSSHFLRGLTLTTRPQPSLNMDTRCSCFRYFTGYPKRNQTHSLSGKKKKKKSAHAKVLCLLMFGPLILYQPKCDVSWNVLEVCIKNPSWLSSSRNYQLITELMESRLKFFRPQNRSAASQQNCVSASSWSTEVDG